VRGRIPGSINFTTYRFLADFFERFVDFELLFDALFLLARARFCAVDADFVLAADFFADFFEDFEPERCFRAFSASISSPSVSISCVLNALLAFGKSSPYSSSTW
jgi:hypothetical protein